jgi:hypothetical protein
MKSIVTKIALLFKSSFKGYFAASEIKEYVLSKYAQLTSKPKNSNVVDRELFELKTNLTILGWIEENGSLQTDENKNEEDARSLVDQWFKDLKNSKIIDQGLIVKGTGANLDWLDDNDKDLKDFKTSALESILRIVEVKRKSIINALSQDLTHDEKIREGLMISIMLSRASRRHEDLRYLNAALKMNDWYFPICRKLKSEKTSVLYLLALTEQERSAAVMLK